MMIVMRESATDEEIGAVIEKIQQAGALAHPIKGARLTVIGAIGDVEQDVNIEGLGLEGQPGVDRLVPILKPYKLASTQIRHGERTVLEIEGRKIGAITSRSSPDRARSNRASRRCTPRVSCAMPG